ncbi:hypothetical protein [Campylobacter sp. CCS1377]|uniref:DUF5659 domain-containing protein n=1 Tax=Campylobacter sp. CCS1377 TaxID=3158229 RepID=A0AAU7E5L9_9BACT
MMKSCLSKTRLSAIVPFSERRAALINFAKKNGFVLKKYKYERGLCYFVSKKELKALLREFENSNKNNFYFSGSYPLQKAFEEVKEFLKDLK